MRARCRRGRVRRRGLPRRRRGVHARGWRTRADQHPKLVGFQRNQTPPPPGRATARTITRASPTPPPPGADHGSDGYPGTTGCELTCEGNDIDEHACASIGLFCDWDDNKCWSAVGSTPCPTAAHAPSSAPTAWTCQASYYNTSDGCDCACGAWDPDCDDNAAHVHGCDALGEHQNNTKCVHANGGTCQARKSVPTEWTCAPSFYDTTDGCDCACGAWDPDCDDNAAHVHGCGALLEHQNNTQCVNTYTHGGECQVRSSAPTSPSVPAEWRCEASWYNTTDGCDCACGAWDPDCDDNHVTSVHVHSCDALGEHQNNTYCLHVDGGTCVAGKPPPAEWRCEAAYYGTTDGCDCDCGAWDPDCDDTRAEEVHGCDLLGEHAQCVHTNLGGTCVAGSSSNGHDYDYHTGHHGDYAGSAPSTAPEEWTCEPTYYGTNDGCDCTCGAWDPDCDDDWAHVHGCDALGEHQKNTQRVHAYGGTCQARSSAPTPPSVPDEWTCGAAAYSTTGYARYCNCDCGAWDPTCDDVAVLVFGCEDFKIAVQAAGRDGSYPQCGVATNGGFEAQKSGGFCQERPLP